MHHFIPPSEQSLEFLKPYQVADEIFTLPSGEKIPIAKYFLRFKEWQGAPIPNDYNGKAVIDWHDEPLFAELAALMFFKENGWQGVWVDSYRRKFRVGLPGVVDPISLPAKQQELYNDIKAKTGRSGGCWDVLVWKENEILFAELKRLKKDRVQSTQDDWLSAALGVGLSAKNFALVEWDLGED